MIRLLFIRDTMNGRQIDYPKYKHFESVIKFLNVGGAHVGVDTSRLMEPS